MSHYKRMRTTTGHRFTVRMAEDEFAGRWIGRIAAAVLTFTTAAGMFLLWVKMG